MTTTSPPRSVTNRAVAAPIRVAPPTTSARLPSYRNASMPSTVLTIAVTKYLSSSSDGPTLVGVKIVVDLDRCQGHGRCYDLAPGLFGPDEEGHVALLVPDGLVGAGEEAEAARAVRSCPERALSLEN